MSDFHETLAKVHAGQCPMCGGELVTPATSEIPDDKPVIEMSDEDRNEALHMAVGFAYCKPCDLGMIIHGAHDPAGPGTSVGLSPRLDFSRELTEEERRKLYDRGAT